MRQVNKNNNEKSNKTRMFLLKLIDSEFKAQQVTKIYFPQNTPSVVANCKIQFKETYTFNEETNTIDCVINKLDRIEFSSSSINTHPSSSAFTVSINLKEKQCLRTYCQQLKDQNIKIRRRKKRTCLTSLVQKSSIEVIKSTLRRRRKANSVCLNKNNNKQ